MPANHVLLETIELTQSAASVTFDNIPQTGYSGLKLVISARGTRSEMASNTLISFNGSTSNFTGKYLEGLGSNPANSSSYARFIGAISAASATSNTFGSIEVYIPNYAGSNYKSFSADSVSENNATLAAIELNAGLWSVTSAITSITISSGSSDNFLANSTFSIYGIAATGTTPTVAPKAQGGNIVANDGTYWYHAFLASGTFTPTIPLTCDYLVIAGGGSGGSADAVGWGGGGGGGAGGLLTSIGGSPISLTSINYSVVIGAGGAGVSGAQGANGTNSSISTLTAIGGGGGGRGSATLANRVGSNGGSGGGGGYSQGTGNGPAGLGTSGQGFAGGISASGNGGGGGGGATAVGGNATFSNPTHFGGIGGAGYSSASAWATATNTGVSGAYAGGGGGGSNSLGAGGSGGGGSGGNNVGTNPTAGTANTGSGGGGYYDVGAGGNGASGIIIIRYTMA